MRVNTRLEAVCATSRDGFLAPRECILSCSTSRRVTHWNFFGRSPL